MKSIDLFIYFVVGFSLCACGKVKKTEAEIERENWISGFSDSITYYQEKSKELESELNTINSQIAGQLNNFEMVKKPREVSGYYLLKGWEKKLPMTSTSIYARINENEKLELIATLAGSTFNQIRVGDYSSEVMKHDQAFNFRHDRFNTVYFTGGKADTIAEYIANHKNEKVTLEYLEGKIKKNFVIPENEKDMISQTWTLFSSQIEARQLQKEFWISSRKIDTFRRIMDELNRKNEKQ